MATTFEYSVLRLVPDQVRGERINVGIVVFLDGSLDVRIYPDLAKVRSLNPNVNANALRELPRTLNALLGAERGAAERLAALQRFPLISATEMGWFQCDAGDYESRIQGLIERFVLTPAKPRRSTSTRLSTDLRKAFANSNMLATDQKGINQHKVVANYPIAEAEGLSADFALKNGAMHFTAAIDLRGTEDTIRGDKRGQTAIKALMFNRASERFAGCSRIAVYIADPTRRELVDSHLAMLRHDTDEMYNFGVRSERAAYMERMQKAARNT